MPTLRAKGGRDLMTRVQNKLHPPQAGEHGYEVVRSSEAPLPTGAKYILKTGIESIDVYCGEGLPFGRTVEIYGIEGSGKTALTLRCCVRAQQRFIYERVINPETKTHTYTQIDPACEIVILYVDNEQTLDEGSKLIVDGLEIDALIARCDTIDELFDMVDKTIAVVEAAADEAAERAEQNDTKPLPCFTIIAVDTIAGTSTKAEMEAEWGTQDYPRAPQALRRAFSKMTRKINRNNVLFIATNQVNESFKPKKKGFVNPYALDLPRPDDFNSPGGRAIKFYSTIRIFMFPINLDYKLSRGLQGPSGFTGGFVTVKNKLFKPRREGRFVLLYEGGLSNVFSILETMLKTKVAVRGEKGVVEFLFRKHGIEPTTFKGLKANTNPRMVGDNAAWAAFYKEHLADMRALWDKSSELTFSEADAVPVDDDELDED